MEMIDLRSDTVTKPTVEMRQAMFEAPVGDDVYGDDPTVKKLEELAAKMVGKEGALFVPSGTFGNQLCLLTHTNRGDEVILEANCHIKKYEVGASSVIAGVMLHTIEGQLGKMDIAKVEAAIREDDIHCPQTRMICLENAYGNGTVLDIEYMKNIKDIANKHNLLVHLDGARLFNAATALNVDAKDICAYVDSVSFCLSKGLCAPIGSIVAGSKEFINKARKNRKLMGGGLRQAGIIAAAGIVGLEIMSKRLEVDHDNAKYLAKRLDDIPCIKVSKDRLDINMVFFSIDEVVNNRINLEEELLKHNIKVNGYRSVEYRFVVHNDVTREDIDKVIEVLNNILK